MKKEMTLRKKRFQKYGTAAFAGGILLLVLLVALNTVLTILPTKVTRFDTTGIGLSELAAEGEGFLEDLDEDVTIYWLCKDGVVDPEIVGDWFTLLLRRYDEANRHLEVQWVNTTTEPAFLAEYGLTAGGFNNHSLIVESDRRYTFVDIANIYKYANAYLDEMMGSPLVMTMDELENYRQMCYYYYQVDILQYPSYQYTCVNAELLSAIDFVTQESIPHGYLLTGYEGETLTAELKELLTNMTERLDVLDISAVTEIPADANCVVLHAPTADLTEAQAAVIKAYLNRGGSLVMNTSPASVQTCPNIQSIAAEFGLAALPGLVTDSAVGAYATGTSTDVLTPSVNSSNQLYMVAENGFSPRMPQSHAIEVTEKSGVTVTPLFTTSASATRVEVGNVGNTLSTPGQMHVAVSAQKQVATSEGTAATAQVVWFGSTEAFNAANATATQNGNYYYYAFAFGLIGPEFNSAYKSIEPIRITPESLEPMGTFMSVLLMVVPVILVPAGLLTVGIVIWVKRRRRH